MYKIIYITLCCCLIQVTGIARQPGDTIPQPLPDDLKLLRLKNAWLQTGNAAALSSVSQNSGLFNISYSQNNGELRLYNQPENENQLQIRTEGYKTLGRYHLFGSFNYSLNNRNKVKWNNVLFPSDNNPFVLADSMGGDFDTEIFDINAGFAMPFKNTRWNWGVKTNYKAGSSADQTDPRPAINAVRYNLAPGLTYAGKNITIGLDALAEGYNEDINITVLNYNLNHHFFLFNGLGNYYPNSGDSYRRNYRGFKAGGSVQAGIDKKNATYIVQIGYTNNFESADDGSVERLFKAGDFVDHYFWTNNTIQLRGNNTLHAINVSGGFHRSDGIWFDQMSVIDANRNVKWVVFSESVKYINDDVNLGVKYDFLKEKALRRNYSLSASAQYKYSNTFYYPEEFYMTYSNVAAAINGAKTFYLHNNWGITAELHAALQYNLSKDADFNGILFSEIISKPAYAYLTADIVNAGGAVSISKFTQNKKLHLHPFLKLGYDTSSGLSAGAYNRTARNYATISIGFLF